VVDAIETTLLSGFLHTRTQEGAGGKEGGNKDSQPEQTMRENNKGRKQAGEHTTSRQNKGKAGRKVGKGGTQKPNPGTRGYQT